MSAIPAGQHPKLPKLLDAGSVAGFRALINDRRRPRIREPARRAKGNSPPFQWWDTIRRQGKPRQGRQKITDTHSAVPPGLGSFAPVDPAI